MLGCRSSATRERSAEVAPELPPGLQIVADADRRALGDRAAARSTVFDGHKVRLRAARGETVGFTLWHRPAEVVTLRFAEARLGAAAFEVQWAKVARPSTSMYGPSRGAAAYPDGLSPSPAPSSNPAYFDVTVPAALPAGQYLGELAVGPRTLAVELQVDAAVLPDLGAHPPVWAYYDPRELAWQHDVPVGSEAAFALETRCAAMFRQHGVLASPELTPEEWPRRRSLVAGARYVPVMLPSEARELPAAARFWSEALTATDQLAFAIPIDEPRTLARRLEVRALAAQVVAARRATGTDRLLMAVTDAPRPIYGDTIDIYISPAAVTRRPALGPAAAAARWTYNGNPPYAGSMVVDAGNTDLRSWGWIAWRWSVPVWYVWDALYWHDRHNAVRARLPRPGRALAEGDAVSFDDGEDHGNLDGVLALPGDRTVPCRPTLRLKALRRGFMDRLLLEAASCTPASRLRAQDVAAGLVPFALGDAAPSVTRTPVTTEQWERARAELLELAAACGR